MRLTELQVRFFRSFNFDYETKANPKAKAKSWENIHGSWFPFIRIEIDPIVTAVVGANESGKSHLIEAIEFALAGKGIDHRDFCRYSRLYSVKEGEIRAPDFGLELALDKSEADLLADAGIPLVSRRQLKFFRLEAGKRLIAIGSGDAVSELDQNQAETLQSLLPQPFVVKATVALPDSITFDDLLGEPPSPLPTRRSRSQFDKFLRTIREEGMEAIQGKAEEMFGMLEGTAEFEGAAHNEELSEADLARMLLIDVAEIAPRSIKDLRRAVREEDEGQVGGLLERMNQALAQRLNFSRWWRQDSDFQLRIATREHELVFTIRDRTGTDYSFEERSRGLQYFLSYYVQLLARRLKEGEPTQILLMDEPDAYLSSLGQQDLLRALEQFARPDGIKREDQVVYVTHSPFLINRNAAHRIRVLDKGTNEEGTRVVCDVAQNHYEPLRSSLGAYVAETTFISGANLLVEGLADQVLLAGVTALLRKHHVPPPQLLNLNEVTIVPAGGASTVPYIAYLARGRGDLKAACVALLDGDQGGLEAKSQLLRKAPGRSKSILHRDYVLDLGSWAEGVDLALPAGVVAREPEDLIPIELILLAARNYAERLIGVPKDQVDIFTAEQIEAQIADQGGRLWKATAAAFAAAFDGASIEKVGFAKELVALLEASANQMPPAKSIAELEGNFASLIAELAELLRRADAEETDERTEKRSEQIVRIFLRDHPRGADRYEADQALSEIESSLEGTAGDEAVRNHLAALRQGFELQASPLDPVEDFDGFREKLGSLASIRRQGFLEASKVAPVKKPSAARKRKAASTNAARQGAADAGKQS
jgi:predicted ATPase